MVLYIGILMYTIIFISTTFESLTLKEKTKQTLLQHIAVELNVFHLLQLQDLSSSSSL
ncbi:hypothetical protein MtrunA17_Chr6g0459251 [Medicago truncatula]|uniref:Transmembrane protein n=1 Tax=Medicago truncatula TaxID=3880 RepID=A0A396HB99_MEDTR|nr:hypothetical protein MtrunA17_Chr6g0459251 [Medicago truncatula]